MPGTDRDIGGAPHARLGSGYYGAALLSLLANYIRSAILVTAGRDRALVWLSSAKKDLLAMPKSVQHVMGSSLREVQRGKTPANARPMKGNLLRGVMEIVDDDEAGTFRVIYTTRIANVVYVLDVFQKKSKSGIATSRADIERIVHRLKRARRDHGKATQE